MISDSCIEKFVLVAFFILNIIYINCVGKFILVMLKIYIFCNFYTSYIIYWALVIDYTDTNYKITLLHI